MSAPVSSLPPFQTADVRDRRALLLDVAAEEQWLAEVGSHPLLRARGGEWGEAVAWLRSWMGTQEAQAACARWVSRRLDMPPDALLALSAPLRPGFSAALLAACDAAGPGDQPLGGGASAAWLCLQVLGWAEPPRCRLAAQWPALAQVVPLSRLPAFLLDAGGDLRAVLHQGDLLAAAGLPVAVRVPPGTWERHLAEESWDRCTTRWRMAPAWRGSADRHRGPRLPAFAEQARIYTCNTAPEALPALERASMLIDRERGTGAASLSPEARSAAEEFLFILLGSRPLTRGRFGLNVPLSFTFGVKAAEVDLVAADARLAVELDGYYHFRDADGYRRDRRKDALLQEHGWFVLRFLSEDVMCDPAGVVAQIERALARLDAAVPNPRL